jgi:hypothetical protein
MIIVLYISYALPHCTTEMVREKFDAMFMNCVFRIAEELKDDTKFPGKKFKRFWINVDGYRHDPMLNYVLDSIRNEGTAKVYYERTQGVDRYWKVKTVPVWPF